MFRIFIQSLIVISLLLSPARLSIAEDNLNDALRKIGPLLREKIEERKSDIKFHSKGDKNREDDQNLETIKVIVILNHDHLSQLPKDLIEILRIKVEQLGGRIGDSAYNNVQGWIQIDKIEELAEWSEIKIIKIPTKPNAQYGNISSEGTQIITADSWHSAGVTGKNVKVGIIDFGFEGSLELFGTELPDVVTTKITGSADDFYSSKHGTACAEIVHDVAPDAEIFLANVSDIEVDFHNATEWFATQNVEIISSSIGLNSKYYVKYMYDLLHGSLLDMYYVILQMSQLENVQDQWNLTINNIVDRGITWVQAGGNDGQKKWVGDFYDWDGDFWLNFSIFEDSNEINFPSYFAYGEEIYVLAAWSLDTDMVTYDDYDLYVVNEYGSTVCKSVIQQSLLNVGIECCKFYPIPGIRYFIGIQQYLAYPQQISILVGHSGLPSLKYFDPYSTVRLNTPSSNPNIITVGAVRYSNPYKIERFSSQGPANDGGIKPDLVAPDGVSTASYGTSGFFGTSSAAPHVAGAIALLKQVYPNWSPNYIRNFLAVNAIDLGVYGKDNVYGSGFVHLPISAMPSTTTTTICTTTTTSTTTTTTNYLTTTTTLPQATRVPIYRYFNPTAQDHFYIAIRNDSLLSFFGYQYECIEAYAYSEQVEGTIPLYRYFNSEAKDHFYIAVRNDALLAYFGYQYECIEAYVHASQVEGTVPLYRYFNPIAKDHFYIAIRNDELFALFGYQYECIEAYVYNSPGN